MILQALITQLKTGSIKNVYTRGNYQVYPGGKDKHDLMEPYVLVFDDYPVNSYYTVNNNIQPVAVEAHYPAGYITELNNYIENELMTLLHRKRLSTIDNTITYNFQVFVTMHISFMSEPNDDKTISGGNDDGTISRFRRIFIPRRGM